MTSNSVQPRSLSTLILLGYILVLILWRTALWLYAPMPTTDGVQSLSHTYSILRGEFFQSTYWHNWMTLYQLPYGFGVVTAPFMAVLPFGTLHNFFVMSLIFALASAAAAWALVRTSPAPGVNRLAVLAAVTVFLYPQLWMMRPETIGFILLALTLALLNTLDFGRNILPRLLIGAFFVAFAGISHPVAGITGVLLVLMVGSEQSWNPRTFVIFYAAVTAFVALLYAPVILMSVDLWLENFIGFFTVQERRGFNTLRGMVIEFLRFVGWSSPLMFLYLVSVAQSWRRPGFVWWREVLYPIVLAIPLIFSGGGQYFTYLLVLILWRLSVLPRPIVPRPLLVAAVLAVAPFWTHYFPTAQHLENPQYGETLRAVMDRVNRYSDRAEVGTVWVSTRIGITIIDEPYARVIANYYELNRYPDRITLEPGSEILTMWEHEASVVFNNYAVQRDQTRIETLVPPVRGLLTFESLLRERLPDMGLWRITAPDTTES